MTPEPGRHEEVSPLPLPLIVHAADCATKRIEGCTCTPQVFDATEAHLARAAHGGDHTRLELGRYTPPVHVNTIHVDRSQARRHGREISN